MSGSESNILIAGIVRQTLGIQVEQPTARWFQHCIFDSTSLPTFHVTGSSYLCAVLNNPVGVVTLVGIVAFSSGRFIVQQGF